MFARLFLYRKLRAEAPPIIAEWERALDVGVNRLYVRQMKTKWGTSNPRARSIRLNTELAKKPRQCLEYIIVHEMVHFLDSRHGNRFITLMDKFMPDWRLRKDELNRQPLAQERWEFETCSPIDR